MSGRVPIHVILCDQRDDVVRAWQDAFTGCAGVDVRGGDFFDIQAEAYVSPANSYGIMDGGIDLALRDYFGFQIQERVQEVIAGRGGRLAVGEAVVVDTGDDEVPYLIAAPTMEAPSNVDCTSNAYEAMRAILNAVVEFNEEHPERITAVAIPGLCTGVGCMDPDVSAAQMRQAYDEYTGLARGETGGW